MYLWPRKHCYCQHLNISSYSTDTKKPHWTWSTYNKLWISQLQKISFQLQQKKQSFVTVHTTDKTPTQTTHANDQSHYANKYNWKTKMIFLVVYGRFPDGYFPGWFFPRKDVSRKVVSRIGRFPDGHFPGKTFPGWSFSQMRRFSERLREW